MPTEDDDAETRVGEALVDRPAKTVAYRQRELVVPDAEPAFLKGNCQWPSYFVLVFLRVGNEHIVQLDHHVQRLSSTTITQEGAPARWA
jgi:hypothetical protein